MKNFGTDLTRSDPLLTLKKLMKERYQDALAVFWARDLSQTIREPVRQILIW